MRIVVALAAALALAGCHGETVEDIVRSHQPVVTGPVAKPKPIKCADDWCTRVIREPRR